MQQELHNPPPRIWTALALGIGLYPVIILFVIAVFSAGVLVMTLLGEMPPLEELGEWAAAQMSTPLGFTLMLVGSQLPLLIVSLGAAYLSPVPMAERLGFRAPQMAWWKVLLCVLPIPFIGAVGSLGSGLFLEADSENIKMIVDVVQSAPWWFLVPLMLMLSVMPGFIEEIVYRGYVQTRLLQRWHPAWAIVVASLLFSAIHLEPAHVLGVLPIAFWLGVLAWKSDSIWPSILYHSANNLFAVVLARWFADEAEAGAWQFSWVEALFYGSSALAFIAALWVLVRHPAPKVRVPEAVPHQFAD